MNKSLILLFSLLFLLACKRQEKASRKPLEGKKAEYLITQLKSNEFKFETLAAKADFSLEEEGKKLNFKANIRIRRDSVIWMSITPALGIELARILITVDTVKVINRLQKEYFIGDYNYINKKFNIDLEYQDIQAVLLGNALSFETDEKLKFAIDKEWYYLGNLKKRKAKKADQKPEVIERKKEEIISLWLEDSSFKIAKFLLSDLTADRFILGQYSNYQSHNDQLLPEHLSFEIQSNKPTHIEIDYSRVTLDQSLKYSFHISSKYEQVYY